MPELVAINTRDTDVLILDGEQLIGAKRNRMASRSILLPAHSETRIPVNCMEQLPPDATVEEAMEGWTGGQ